ncbi:hemolymph lipopolysaccharide-binding protein [Anabrus simplex]|uniref:hemolymph lipopolysaccharide-binding protein n=1 Tax=Anabrus simplex TaxID=316456 RepID=UPI0035A26F80
MWLLNTAVLLGCLLVACPGEGSSSQCGSTTKKGYKISIVSHHNESGYHVEEVVIEDSSGKPLQKNLWSMNVKVGNTSCLGKTCALIKAHLSPVSAVSPPAGYVSIQDLGYSYKFHYEKRTWGEAKMICESEGAHLAVIDGELDRYIILALYQRYDANSAANNKPLMVGFSDVIKSGDYRTVLGEPISCLGYKTWASGQPDATAGNCGAINGKGELTVISCGLQLPFICQWQA